jgi:hypothetical protein
MSIDLTNDMLISCSHDRLSDVAGWLAEIGRSSSRRRIVRLTVAPYLGPTFFKLVEQRQRCLGCISIV